MVDPKLRFGERVKSLRAERGWTQDQLAEKMEISSKYVSSIERGKENPTFDLFIKLSTALKVELWELFDSGHELTPKELRGLLKSFASEIPDEKLKITVKILRAISR